MILYRSLLIVSKERNLKILERLAEKGYLQNTRHLGVFEFDSLLTSSFVPFFCSMKNLETFTCGNADYVKLEDFAPMLQSCSELRELSIKATVFKIDEMDGDLVDQLRSGFRKLRRLYIKYCINDDSWPGIQKMLT